ncbi:hypothetical protein EfmAA242_11440 [Enterococcus faecium]|nr:hypothetical protein EfmAA242_11440 [Enterococcus faecium]
MKPEGRKAVDIENSINEWLQSVPKNLFKSITFDCGKEFSNWKSISNTNDIDIYFADPGTPSQRGLNEHSNGLLRKDGRLSITQSILQCSAILFFYSPLYQIQFLQIRTNIKNEHMIFLKQMLCDNFLLILTFISYIPFAERVRTGFIRKNYAPNTLSLCGKLLLYTSVILVKKL